MRSLVLLFVVTLAGCANTTPRALEEAGPASLQWWSQRTPAEVARCIAANADNVRLGLLARTSAAGVRSGPTTGAYEITYSDEGWLVFFARVEPDGAGSLTRLWRSSFPVRTFHDEGSLEDQVRRGCD